MKKIQKYVFFGFLFFFLLLSQLYAFGSRELFSHFPNKYFVETGSHRGDGIEYARLVGYSKIFSVELSLHYYQLCKDRFANFEEIYLYQGNSSKVLPHILDQIYAPATFWLDAHYSSGDTAKGDTNSPILTELECIKKHHIKTHTILIDDVRLFGTSEFDYVTLEQIYAALKRINPNYQFFFMDGFVKNDILVAKTP